MNEFPGSSPSSSSSGDDERMRQLFDDAVADVKPHDSLDSIRARTVVTPFRSKRPWILGAGAAAVATAATVAAVAVMGGSPGTTGAQDPGFAGTESPTPSSKPPTEPTSTPTSDDVPGPELTTLTVPVYYVGETSRGPRLYREFHAVETSLDKPQAALVEAMTSSPDDPDYRTDWPAGTSANSVTMQGDVITVDLDAMGPDLHDRPLGMTEQEASMAIEQLIYTAQAAIQTRSPVQFMLNGERTDTVLGVPTSEPLSQGQDFEVLAMVWVIESSEGAKLQSPFKVSGLANAFEANVQWELMQDETVVDKGFTTARECCTMAPYSFKVTAPPGDYTLVVHDSDPSDGEGFGPTYDTKNITVTE